MRIREYTPADLDAIIEFGIRSWTPVFPKMEEHYLPAVWKAFFPEGWQTYQRNAIQTTLADPDVKTFVVIIEDQPVGYASLKLHFDDMMGEVYMIATDPDHQGKGVAKALIEKSNAWFRENNMKITMIETGADDGHAPARRAYEKAGYSLTPIARYFKEL